MWDVDQDTTVRVRMGLGLGWCSSMEISYKWLRLSAREGGVVVLCSFSVL